MAKNNRILLVEPPFYRLFKLTYSNTWNPLNLAYLAGSIKRDTDWDVMSYNSDFQKDSETIRISHLAGKGFANYLDSLRDLSRPIWREIESVIRDYQPRAVGISAKSQNYASAVNIAKVAKAIDPSIIVILGGVHACIVGPDILKNKEIDICAVGEGEETQVELLEAISSNAPLENVKGIIYRNNGHITQTPRRDFIENLDTLVHPHDYADGILKDYQDYPLSAFSNILTSRGCPYNCFFCGSRSIWTRKVRSRSTENIIQEVKKLQNKGIEQIHFYDDTIAINKNYITAICNGLIEHCPGIEWSAYLHVNSITDDLVALMKKAGCRTIKIGIESGNNEILKKIRKHTTIEEAISACDLINRYDIYIQACFIVGFPWETEQTLNDSIKAMKRIRYASISYSIFTPYPGSEAHYFLKEKGLIGPSFDLSLYNHQSPENCFSLNIPPERFRKLAIRVEKMVDSINFPNRRSKLKNHIKRLLNFDTLTKLREYGAVDTTRRALAILSGK